MTRHLVFVLLLATSLTDDFTSLFSVGRAARAHTGASRRGGSATFA